MPFDAPKSWDLMTAAERCRAFADELNAWAAMGAVFPDGSKWDYSECRTCAMGYAFVTGGTDHPSTSKMAEYLGIPETKARSIFIFSGVHLGSDEVSPGDIANLLREHAETLDG